MIIIIILLSLIVITLGYTTFNLMKKSEKQEEIIEKQTLFISEFSEAIKFSSERLKEIDEKGSFESDDEIGFFFENVKNLQVMLNQFLILEENSNNENKEK